MSIYEHRGYFQEYLESKGVDLNNHIELNQFLVDIDYRALISWSEKNFDRATIKEYKPRPFYSAEAMKQSVLAQFIGYNANNTIEINWGIDPADDAILKSIIGNNVFEQWNLDPETSMVRLLRYDPGHCIPLHTDSYNSFSSRFGTGTITRYFVAVSPWVWGHFLQVHDNLISNWDPGLCAEIPNEVFHLSGNFGIAPKYTLTVTGLVQ